MMKQKSMYSD